MYKIEYIPASKDEILFIRQNMPRGMVAMIQVRTGLKRTQVLYQIMQMPENQNREVIQAARDILYAVTGLKYQGDAGRHNVGPVGTMEMSNEQQRPNH